jgi:hypothetical protein
MLFDPVGTAKLKSWVWLLAVNEPIVLIYACAPTRAGLAPSSAQINMMKEKVRRGMQVQAIGASFDFSQTRGSAAFYPIPIPSR